MDQLGPSDDERIAALNERASHAGGRNTPIYEFANRIYSISIPMKLYSGLKLRGNGGLPSREYGSGTTIRWAGPPNTSVFTFPPDGQSNQNYPADGSPRDVTISGILFEGGSQTDVFPKLAMSSDSFRGNTLWYSSLHNLGVRAMRTFWWGYGTGVSLHGSFHAQAMSETPLFVGGSENTIFGTDAQSFLDNSSDAWTTSGKPLIRSVMEKSYIGRAIVTARSDSYHLSVEGGRGLMIGGVQFDAPASAPTSGSAIRVSNVDGLVISGCVFYANMARPAGIGRGIIEVTGGRDVVIYGNQFLNGPAQDPTAVDPETPIVFNSSSEPVKVGMNGFPGYAGVVTGNIFSSDPALKVVPG